MRAFLKSSEGFFQLKSGTTSIGSHRGADIVLQSAGVAARHAALQFSASDKSFILRDFNSPHGTFVNGCQVQNAAVRVSPGDVLSFGTAGASFQLLLDGDVQVGMGMCRERWRCAGKGGCHDPWKDAQTRMDGDVQGKVPGGGGWVGAAALERLQKQKLT
ncbi:FHAD1 protein, partial [Catharus fuscescens]|nr:FHAD1 protein [Catharus fuscescens]